MNFYCLAISICLCHLVSIVTAKVNHVTLAIMDETVAESRYLASLCSNKLTGSISCIVSPDTGVAKGGVDCDQIIAGDSSFSANTANKCIVRMRYTYSFCNKLTNGSIVFNTTLSELRLDNSTVTGNFTTLPRTQCRSVVVTRGIDVCTGLRIMSTMKLVGNINGTRGSDYYCFSWTSKAVEPKMLTRLPTKSPTRTPVKNNGGPTRAPTKTPIKAPVRTREPSASLQCRVTANITCVVKATGQTCDDYTIPLTSQCGPVLPVTYKYVYCNQNQYNLVLNPTKSFIKSEFYNYAFNNITIKPATCVVQRHDGMYNTCNETSYASINLNGKYDAGSSIVWCYEYEFLSVKPKRLTENPTLSPLKVLTKNPTKAPMKGQPTKAPIKGNPTKAPIKGPSQRPSKVPTFTRYPTVKPSSLICNMLPSKRASDINQKILTVSSAGSLTNSSSAQSRALSWLINDDGLRLCANDSKLIQRYVMAVFYFSTRGDDTWVACGRNSKAPCISFRSFLAGDPVKPLFGDSVWLSSVDECLWGALACNSQDGSMDRIEFNNLMSNKIGGSLPSEITQLSKLRFLIIKGCCSASIPTYNVAGFVGLSGTIPSDIGTKMTSLRILDLNYNYLSGSLPVSVYQIPNLRDLYLNYNKMSGTITSPNGSALSKIVNLFLDNNSFSGSIPNLNLKTMVNCTLSRNKFNGTMPQTVCALRTNAAPPGLLANLETDCKNNTPVTCACCTACF